MDKPKKIINYLESDSSMDEAFFAFYHEEDHLDHEHIKANPDGLKRFASYLLRIAYDIEPNRSEYEKNTFPIDDSLFLRDDSSVVKFLELRSEKKSDYKQPPEYKLTWADRLIPIGCGIALITVIILAIIGFFNLL